MAKHPFTVEVEKSRLGERDGFCGEGIQAGLVEETGPALVRLLAKS